MGAIAGVEPRPILPAKVQLTANCPRTNSSPACSQLQWEKFRFAERGGEDWRVLARWKNHLGVDVPRLAPRKRGAKAEPASNFVLIRSDPTMSVLGVPAQPVGATHSTPDIRQLRRHMSPLGH